jgi:hypothetical protein
LLLGTYAIMFGSLPAKAIWAVGMLIAALAIATAHRRRKPTIISVGD